MTRTAHIAAVLFLTSAAATAAPPADTVPKPDPPLATGCWASALKERPRLFGPKSYLQALAKANPSGYRNAKSVHFAPKNHVSLTALGIVEAVEGAPRAEVDAAVRSALAVASAGPTNKHQDTWLDMEEVALTYDFFYNSISPADRAKMIAYLNGCLRTYTTDEDAFHNSTLTKIAVYLHVAYATAGDNPMSSQFRDYAIIKLYEMKVVPVLLAFGAGGGFTECGWYTRGSLAALIDGLELARRMEKYDGFQKASAFFYQRMAYELYECYPNPLDGAERYPCEGDGSNIYGFSWENARLMRTTLGQYFHGSELARVCAAYTHVGYNPEARMMDWLESGSPNERGDLKEAPLAHLARGIGHVYARSDWSPGATWFSFTCEPFWTLHQHYDVGHFEIFQNEPLATESGEYEDVWGSSHNMNWLIRTVAHNCVLVYDPSEKWSSQRDKDRVMTGNDGGQGGGAGYHVADALPRWQKNVDERGSIVAYQNAPEYLYVAGDCTKAYSPTKLSGWLRQVVFVRPNTFIILDRVVATRPEFEKTWLLHSRNEPEITSAGFTVTNGPGRLTVQTLLPDKAKIAKVKGYAYRGKTYDAKTSALTPAANLWRVEVAPPKAAASDVFLHVLTTGKPPAQPAEVLKKGSAVGAKVGEIEVLFDKLGGTLKIGPASFTLKGEVTPGKWE